MVRLSDENEFAVICLSNDHAIKLYPNTMVEEKIRKLAAKFQQQSRITVVTGAGVSAASGVPTFRGAGGLWKTHKPESLATAAAFERDPKLVWDWYDWRRQILSTKQP